MRKLSVAFSLLLLGFIIFIGCTNVSDFRWNDIPETPVPGNSGTIVSSNITPTSVDLLWVEASDNQTPTTNLLYLVYFSSTDNIKTVSDMEANGTAIGFFTNNITRKTVSGLNSQTTCYLNVMVKDEATNKAAYTMKSVTIPEGGLPIAGNSGLLTITNTTGSIILNWTKATDAVSPQFALEYLVYYSTSSNISSVADMEANGTAIGSYGQNINSKDITELDAGPHYFNVLVKDEAGNKNSYEGIEVFSYSVIYTSSATPTSGSMPIDNNFYFAGQEVSIASNANNLLLLSANVMHYVSGWTNSEGDDYEAGDTFNINSTNVTLYAKWTALSLRDVGPAGGFIFYDKGTYSTGPSGIHWRYLEAAPSDQTNDIGWFKGEMSTLGVTNTGLGAGFANTTNVVNALGDGNYATRLCYDLVLGGYDDWFLPSKDELNKIYINLKSGTDENNVNYTPIGDFIEAYYWSSTEGLALYYPWIQYFENGNQASMIQLPSVDISVRAIRAF